MRGSRAARITMNADELMLPDGFRNCAWLNALNSSARKCSDECPARLTIFISAKSVLLIPGPWESRRGAGPHGPMALLLLPPRWRARRGALPTCPSGSTLTVAFGVLIQFSVSRGLLVVR